MFYAYYGDFKRFACRVEFKSETSARIAMWNDAALFGLHKLSERTATSRRFEAFGRKKRQAHKELHLPIAGCKP
jgi:hypothetical protein